VWYEAGGTSRNMKMFYYIRRFWEISKIEKELLISGYLFSLISVLTINILPFKYCLKHIRKFPKFSSDIQGIGSLLNAKKTIRRIINIAPWAKNCLIKSLTFRYLLGNSYINSKIILSLRKEGNNKLSAHAYITIDNKYFFFKNETFNDLCNLDEFFLY
jgi:hypothetical protein